MQRFVMHSTGFTDIYLRYANYDITYQSIDDNLFDVMIYYSDKEHFVWRMKRILSRSILMNKGQLSYSETFVVYDSSFTRLDLQIYNCVTLNFFEILVLRISR